MESEVLLMLHAEKCRSITGPERLDVAVNKLDFDVMIQDWNNNIFGNYIDREYYYTNNLRVYADSKES